MSPKKIMAILIGVSISGIVFFVFVLYTTIKTKSTNIKKFEPFSEWVGKTVELNRQTVVLKEKLILNNSYPYTLMDSLHPDWQYMEQRKHLSAPDVEEIAVFPKGSKLTVEKAINYTNGVSGFSTPMLFGRLSDGSRSYKIGYQWGKMDIGRNFDKLEESWQFHHAPWQSAIDTAYYALPQARFW